MKTRHVVSRLKGKISLFYFPSVWDEGWHKLQYQMSHGMQYHTS